MKIAKKKQVMLRVSCLLRREGQYCARLKKRTCGFIPKVVPRKIKGNLIALRSEAATGSMIGHLKSEFERMDMLGRKVQHAAYDPVIRRYVLFRESKIKAPFLTKANIQPKFDGIPGMANKYWLPGAEVPGNGSSS